MVGLQQGWLKPMAHQKVSCESHLRK